MKPSLDTVAVQRIRFHLEKICICQDICPSVFERFIDGAGLHRMVIELMRHYPKQQGPVVKVPRDWWQHIRERFWPKWAKKRWPVRYREYQAELHFPHSRHYPAELGVGYYEFMLISERYKL